MESEFPRFDLHGQVPLVTGAARGLGRAIAVALAQAGADVALGLRDINTGELVREIEALVLVTLYWTCLAAIRRSRWLPIALGFFFASKQYTVLVVPLTGLLLPRFAWKAYFRLNLAGAAVAAAITVPLAFWHWHDFWRGVVVWQFLQPFRPDALSASVLAVRLGFPQIPEALVIAVVFLTIAWSLRVTRPRPSAFPGCVALVLLCFFALNKQAFVNYYFLVIGAVLLAAVLHDRPVPLTTTCIEPPATRLQT